MRIELRKGVEGSSCVRDSRVYLPCIGEKSYEHLDVGPKHVGLRFEDRNALLRTHLFHSFSDQWLVWSHTQLNWPETYLRNPDAQRRGFFVYALHPPGA